MRSTIDGNYEERKRQHFENLSFLSSVEMTEMKIEFAHEDNQGFIIAKIKDITKAFFPIEFCELTLIAQAQKADAAKFSNGKSDLNKQAKIFVKFKTHITQIIERYKRFTDDYPEIKKDDFDSFIRQVDTAINESKLNIEIKLLNSQITTNKSSQETNRISKITNIYIAIFTFIAAEYYCYEFLRDYISDLNNYKKTIINLFLIALAVLGIIGYRRIKRKSDSQIT